MVGPLGLDMCLKLTTALGHDTGRFSPRSIAGLTNWYDASDFNSITMSGSEITEIANKVGGDSLTKLSNGGPHYVSSSRVSNGLPAIMWPNEKNLLGLTLSDEIFFKDAFIALAFADGEKSIFDVYNTIITDEKSTQGSSRNRIMGGAQTAKLFNGTLPKGMDVRTNGGDISLDVLPLPLSVLHFRTPYGFPTYNFGGKNFNAPRGWNGPMCEILLFDEIIAETDTAMIIEYLKEKWSIAALNK